MDWSIRDVAARAGTTSRTLRHYGDVGLLAPSRVGPGGERFYDRDAVVRLQRILLLRELGLSLAVIAEVLTRQTDVAAALSRHIGWLEQERARIDRQIGSVRRTLAAMDDDEEITMETMLDGFDHSRYEDEVRERWGDDAWRRSAAWWGGLTPEQKRAATAESERVNGALRQAALAGEDPAGETFQAAVGEQHAWLSAMPGPGTGRQMYLALADMYATDERFAANYGGLEPAGRVREAIGIWVERNL